MLCDTPCARKVLYNNYEVMKTLRNRYDTTEDKIKTEKAQCYAS